MWSLVRAVTAVFDGGIGLFQSWNPMIGLLAVSIVTGGIMLVIFRYTSNQEAIARTKNLIKAYILEVRLFQDDLRLQMAAQRKILVTNFHYMRYALAPMLVMLVPVLIILIQLDVRYARRPFRPGETAVLRVALEEETPLSSLAFEVPDGIAVEAGPLRVEERNELDWRIRFEKGGPIDAVFTAGSDRTVKRLEVGDRLTKLSESRGKPNLLSVWANPAEAPLPASSAFHSIEIDYPDRDLRIWGFGTHWLVVFFGASVIFGFAIKGFVGVEV